MFCCEWRLKAAAWDLAGKHEKEGRKGGTEGCRQEMNRKIDQGSLTRRWLALMTMIETLRSCFPNSHPPSDKSGKGGVPLDFTRGILVF